MKLSMIAQAMSGSNMIATLGSLHKHLDLNLRHPNERSITQRHFLWQRLNLSWELVSDSKKGPSCGPAVSIRSPLKPPLVFFRLGGKKSLQFLLKPRMVPNNRIIHATRPPNHSINELQSVVANSLAVDEVPRMTSDVSILTQLKYRISNCSQISNHNYVQKLLVGL